MLRLTASLAIAAAAITATAAPALAQSQQQICAQRDAIIQRLESKYGEVRQALGVQRNNGVVEIFASPDTGSWTIVVTLPTGMTCLMAAGENYEQQDAETAKKSGIKA